jgi:hypothetical protein
MNLAFNLYIDNTGSTYTKIKLSQKLNDVNDSGGMLQKNRWMLNTPAKPFV